MVKTTRGIVPILADISEEEINKEIDEFLENVEKGLIVPPDYLVGKSRVELRPYAVNTILYIRAEKAKREIRSSLSLDQLVKGLFDG